MPKRNCPLRSRTSLLSSWPLVASLLSVSATCLLPRCQGNYLSFCVHIISVNQTFCTGFICTIVDSRIPFLFLILNKHNIQNALPNKHQNWLPGVHSEKSQTMLPMVWCSVRAQLQFTNDAILMVFTRERGKAAPWSLFDTFSSLSWLSVTALDHIVTHLSLNFSLWLVDIWLFDLVIVTDIPWTLMYKKMFLPYFLFFR